MTARWLREIRSVRPSAAPSSGAPSTPGLVHGSRKSARIAEDDLAVLPPAHARQQRYRRSAAV